MNGCFLQKKRGGKYRIGAQMFPKCISHSANTARIQSIFGTAEYYLPALAVEPAGEKILSVLSVPAVQNHLDMLFSTGSKHPEYRTPKIRKEPGDTRSTEPKQCCEYVLAMSAVCKSPNYCEYTKYPQQPSLESALLCSQILGASVQDFYMLACSYSARKSAFLGLLALNH